MIQVLKKLLASRKGNFATTAALAAIPVFGTISLGIDYTYLYRMSSSLQETVDAAALATARELTIAGKQRQSLQQFANDYLHSLINQNIDTTNTKLNLDINSTTQEVSITVTHLWEPFFIHYLYQKALPITVSATAKTANESTICMLGLDEGLRATIHLKQKAKMRADGCGVYSNSSSKNAIIVENDASLHSDITCSAGGYKGKKSASFSPTPIADCPMIGDPLAGRPKPSVGMCDFNKFKVDTGSHILSPGTYCKGLKIRGDATVWLKPGIYIIEGSKLEVTDSAKLEGKNVAFYLHGDDAKLRFKKNTTINLTAPKDGLLAGILIFEDRQAAPSLQKHEISSDNARMLLGTIYLPNGRLKIDSDAPISDKAAYTAIIARTIELAEGPTLHLNSDYKATDIPVPDGLIGTKTYLVK